MDKSIFDIFCVGLENQDTKLTSDLLLKFVSNKNILAFHKQLKDKYKETKTYSIMITFTIDPNKHDVKDKKLHSKIEKYVAKFPINKCCEVIRADYVREGTDKDHKHTHWHLGIKTNKPFLNKTTKYYRNLYGHVDISRSYDNNYDNVLKYINKSIESTKVPL